MGDHFGNLRWVDLVDNVTITLVGLATGIDELTGPRFQGLALQPNVPNPFSSATQISFVLGRSGPLQLSIYDASGRLVRSLLNTVLNAGHHVLPWSGVDDAGQRLPSGVYFYRLAANGRTETKKAVLLK